MIRYIAFFGSTALFLLVFYMGIPHVAFAVEPKFTPLVNIPGITDLKTASLSDYFNKIYILLIALGAMFGVIKIAIAGMKYTLSGVISDKESARGDIKGVLLGLLLLLIPFIVLSTINPNLVKLNVLDSVQGNKLDVQGTIGNGNSRGTTLNNSDGSKNAEIQKGADAPAGTIRTSCSYVPSFESSDGCYKIIKTTQTDPNCQVQQKKCIADCTSKSGTYQNVMTGSSDYQTGVIICTQPQSK